MKKIFTLLALTISFSMNAQMEDNSANNNSAGFLCRSNGICTTASGIFYSNGKTEHSGIVSSTAMGLMSIQTEGYSGVFYSNG